MHCIQAPGAPSRIHNAWAIPEKKQTGGVEGGLRIYFFEKIPGIFRYLTLPMYPWKFQIKQSLTPGSSGKLC